MRRLLSILLSVLLLLGCMNGLVIASETPKTFLSAEGKWTMGSGWVDCSTTETIAFENTTESAGPNFCKDLIDGKEGFRIGFDVDFLTLPKQTTADVTLRLNSNTMAYFRLLVTSRGNDELLFEVSYCDNGSWIQVVPLIDNIKGADGKVHVAIEREAVDQRIRFALYKTDGTLLYSKAAQNKAFSPGKFLNCSDLEFIVKPIVGYGLFRFSGYSVESYPDDGVDNPPSVAESWNLSPNWDDMTDESGPAIGNRIENAGPCFYNEQINGANDFSIRFQYTGRSDYTTADMTLRLTSNNQIYLRYLLTQDKGKAFAELNFYDGSRWSQLFRTDWIDGVGDTYDILIEHTGDADTIKTTLTKTDGTVFFSTESTCAACTNDSFYSVSPLEALVTTAGNYGLFTIRNFKVTVKEDDEENIPEPIATDLWNYGTGWAAYLYEENDIELVKTDRSQTEAIYTRYIEGSKGFRINFDITFDRPEDSACYFKLRIPTGDEVYLFARIKGSRGQTLLEAQYYFASSDQWSTSLLSANAAIWQKNNGTVNVTLERKALSESMRFRAADKLTGELLFDETITSDVLSPEAFLDYNGLQWIFGADGGTGTFRIWHFTVEEYPADPVPVETAEINGPTHGVTGERLEYKAVIAPADATVKSYIWLLDGSRLGAGRTVNCRFDEPGEHKLMLTITDQNGHTLTVEKTVTIEPAPVVYVPLDLNKDGSIDTADAQMILDADVGLLMMDEYLQQQADLNNDGVLTAEDAYLLLNEIGSEKRAFRSADLLPEPNAENFRFNGHWVTDRSSFQALLPDWTLRSSSDSAPVIIAGSPGEGVGYARNLPERWYMQVEISTAQNDENGVVFYAGDDQLLTVSLKTADNLLTLTINGTSYSLGAVSEKVKLLLDKTAETLYVYIYSGGIYLGGTAPVLPESFKEADRMTFNATRTGTEFSAFGVNDMLYAYEDEPGTALTLMEQFAKREIEGSIVYADNGVPMYTPDGVKNYNALWTRDFTYMLEYGGDYIPTENAVACIEYLLEHVHEGDCWLPDRVYANGAVNYAAGDMPFSRANLDNSAFIVIALDCALSRMRTEDGKVMFSKWESTIRTALNSLAKDENGLVYNDPLNPHSPYGFTDCVCKTGSLMMESLLLWRAESLLAKWQNTYGLDASESERNAKRIEDVLVQTFINEDGMLNAATVDCCQSDIWGSCYAISIGFPMTDSVKKSISDYIAANYDGLVQMGQIRHTAPGTYWQKLLSGVNEGDYQNGAYWATPSGWVIDALEPYHPDLAMITLQDLITYFEQVGIYECINGNNRKLNHYGASASNILPAARRLLNSANALTELRISGQTEAKTGAVLSFAADLTPASVRISEWRWTINGIPVDGAETMTYRFTKAGEYTISCKAADMNGRMQEDSLTITVTDGVYEPVIMTLTEITGKVNDEIVVTYGLKAGSNLVFADFAIDYDAEILAPIFEADGLCAKGSDLVNGVLSANRKNPGTISVALAATTPIENDGELFSVRFRLFKEAKGMLAIPAMQTGGIDAKDGSGIHMPVFQVELPAAPPDPPVTENPFADVKQEEFYYDAVIWALNADPQITSGTSSTTFSPDDTCTRAQVVTFLWRAKGCPEPKSASNPFKDVVSTEYYYKAVLWAVENEITTGTSTTTFSPSAGCTRAQVVTFLWRTEEKPQSTSSGNLFKDISSSEYYYAAVLWAVEKGITKGTSATTFSPHDTCTRGQIVTFLWRADSTT